MEEEKEEEEEEEETKYLAIGTGERKAGWGLECTSLEAALIIPKI